MQSIVIRHSDQITDNSPETHNLGGITDKWDWDTEGWNGSYAQMADTFMLFGDPATILKVPLPHIPTGVSADLTGETVSVNWQPSTDCNKKPVAGYNIYRASSPAGPFKKINSQEISATGFAESSASAAMAGSSGNGVSYYAVSAVDNSGFESVPSLAVKPAAVAVGSSSSSGGGGSGGGGGGGCFISTAQEPLPASVSLIVLIVIGALAVVKGLQPSPKDASDFAKAWSRQNRGKTKNSF